MFFELLSDLRFRFRAVFQRRALERELDEELRFHIEREAERLHASGLPTEEAARRARAAFGGLDAVREESRDIRGFRWIDIALRDLRLAVRSLRSQPAFTTIAVLSLTIGIAMTAVVLTMSQALHSGGLAFGDVQGVVALSQPSPSARHEPRYYFEGRLLAPLVPRATQLRTVALLRTEVATVRTDTSDHLINVVATTPSLTSVLGMRAELGRVFTPADTAPGARGVVLLSHDFWIAQFGGDRAVLDRPITLSGQTYTIVGVVPRDLTFPSDTKLWITQSRATMLADSSGMLQAFARLSAGTTPERADAELTAIARAGSLAGHAHGPLPVVRVVPLNRYLTYALSGVLDFLTTIGVVIGLIASVNFAALVLARGMRRREELGIRAALGASTTRLVTHLLAECAILGVMGGTLGALLAPSIIGGIRRLVPQIIPPWLHQAWGMEAGAAAIGLAIALGVVFGIAPAIELARPAASGFLRSGMGGAVGLARQRRGRRALVTFQVFLAVAPVVYLAIAMGPALNFRAPTDGMDMRGLFTGTMWDSGSRDSLMRARAQMLRAMRGVPGVQTAAVSLNLNLSAYGVEVDPGGSGNFVRIGGSGGPWHGVSDQYFATVRPTLVAGRYLTEDELTHGAPVAVVSANTSRTRVGGIRTGWTLRMGVTGSSWVTATVVGVVADVVPSGVGQVPDVEIYSPIAALAKKDYWIESVWMRSTAPPWRIVPTVYTALHTQVPAVTLQDLQLRTAAMAPMIKVIGALVVMIGGSFAIAVLLAAVGMYGTVAYSAASRRKELAIRVAMGAARMNVAFLVTREATVQTLIGVALGIAGGVATVMYFAPTPDEFKGPPVAIIVTCCLIILLVLALACIIPVRRVWNADTATLLREDG